MKKKILKKLIQALVDECLDCIDSGMCHDGIDSPAAKALLNKVEILEQIQNLQPGHCIVRHVSGKWSAGLLYHMIPGCNSLKAAMSKANYRGW